MNMIDRYVFPVLVVPVLLLAAPLLVGTTTEAHASKFTHPLRAYVTLSKSVQIRSSRQLQKRMPQKTGYQWPAFKIDGRTSCAFVGKVKSIDHTVDLWKVHDLDKQLLGSSVVAIGPCLSEPAQKTVRVELNFSPRYEGKNMAGTLANGRVLLSHNSVQLAPGGDVDVAGHRFCLRDAQAFAMEKNGIATGFNFDIRVFPLHTVAGKRLEVLPVRVGHIQQRFEKVGPFTVLVSGTKSEGTKSEGTKSEGTALTSVTLEIFESYR